MCVYRYLNLQYVPRITGKLISVKIGYVQCFDPRFDPNKNQSVFMIVHWKIPVFGTN